MVLRGLAAQAGTSYLTAVDPACVRRAPGHLFRDEVRALGIVPLRTVETERVMAVACAAPVPRAALAALRELTGYTPMAYLVSDEDYDMLASAYGTEAPAEIAAKHTAHVVGVQDAARRIAEAASAERSITVARARVDPLTWVRIAGKHGVNTMLVSPGSGDDDLEEDDSWLAGTTRH
jgi:hypothetical protein